VIEVLSLFCVNFNVTVVERTVGSCYCSENGGKTQACFYSDMSCCLITKLLRRNLLVYFILRHCMVVDPPFVYTAVKRFLF